MNVPKWNLGSSLLSCSLSSVIRVRITDLLTYTCQALSSPVAFTPVCAQTVLFPACCKDGVASSLWYMWLPPISTHVTIYCPSFFPICFLLGFQCPWATYLCRSTTTWPLRSWTLGLPGWSCKPLFLQTRAFAIMYTLLLIFSRRLLPQNSKYPPQLLPLSTARGGGPSVRYPCAQPLCTCAVWKGQPVLPIGYHAHPASGF